jgi:hypothetical protein
MESDLGFDEPPSRVVTLEEDLVTQFGPGILDSMGPGQEAMDAEEEETEEPAPEERLSDFYDEVPLDLRSGAHQLSSSSSEDEDMPPENPLRAMLNKVTQNNFTLDMRYCARKKPFHDENSEK